MEILTAALATLAMAATPLLLAALGEVVTERAGVLNLGIEGMMLLGAIAGFAAALTTGSTTLGFLAGAGAGVLAAGLFAAFAIGLGTNQIATGLALAILGTGVSAVAGQPFVGRTLPGLPALPGPLAVDIVVWLAPAGALCLAWWLAATRAGLVLRAVGGNPAAAHALGHPVRTIRVAATLFGGAMAGLGGAYISLAHTPMWSEGVVAGRGWIVVALVVFAAWRPLRVLAGAYLFGGVAVLQLHLQGSSTLALPPEFLSMLPYLATIAALVLLARSARGAPAGLGRPFRPDA